MSFTNAEDVSPVAAPSSRSSNLKQPSTFHAHQKYAGLVSNSRMIDTDRISKMQRASDYGACPCYPASKIPGPVSAIQKGPIVKDMTKMERIEKKRQILELQGSVIVKHANDPSAAIPASGNVAGYEHAEDVSKIRQQGVPIPYEPRDPADFTPQMRTLDQIRTNGEWEDSAGKLPRHVEFGVADRGTGIAPYDDQTALHNPSVRRVQDCIAVGENVAGNVGNKCHFMLHEKKNEAVPYEESNDRALRGMVKENLGPLTEQAAGKSRQQAHVLDRSHAKMDNAVVPYSAEEDRYLRSGPPADAALVGHAGKSGNRGHVNNNSEEYNVPNASGIAMNRADYEGAAGTKNADIIRAEGIPYEPSFEIQGVGLKKVAGKSDPKSDAVFTSHVQHIRSETRGANPITHAFPRDDVATFRSGVKMVEPAHAQGKSSKRVLVGETVVNRNLRKHIPVETTMTMPYQQPRAYRGAASKPADNDAYFKHQEHVNSKKGDAPPPMPRTNKRVYPHSATTGIVPYESAKADVYVYNRCPKEAAGSSPIKHLNRASHNRSQHLQSSGMMDILQPIYSHHQE